MSEVVLVDVKDRVATITLNRPESRNALSRDLRRELPKAVAATDARDDVDVLILTGADPAFCAGLDLKELGSGGNTDAAAWQLLAWDHAGSKEIAGLKARREAEFRLWNPQCKSRPAAA